MQRKMEQGGFHGYQKSQNSGSGMKLSDINMRQLAEINNTKNGNNNIVINNVVNNGGATGAGGSAPAAAADDNECTVREQDRFMPIANVIRIMRKILPPHAKISDDAKETIQECVSEYISFITGEANERCQREQRKTITAEDVLWAMSKLGFDDYIEPLTLYLHRFRELEGDRGSLRTDSLMKTSSSSRAPFAAAEYHAAAAAAASATGSFGFGVAGFAPFHHQGFFGYLKEASAPNGAAAAGSSSQQNANGDHQAQHNQYNNNK